MPTFQPERVFLQENDEQVIDQIYGRIKERMQHVKGKFVLVVSGTSTNVGKSYVHRALLQRFYLDDIKVTGSRMPHDLIEMSVEITHQDQVVIFSEMWEMGFSSQKHVEKNRDYIRQSIETASRGIIKAVDFWVALESAESPFLGQFTQADIIVHNLGAKNKY